MYYSHVARPYVTCLRNGLVTASNLIIKSPAVALGQCYKVTGLATHRHRVPTSPGLAVRCCVKTLVTLVMLHYVDLSRVALWVVATVFISHPNRRNIIIAKQHSQLELGSTGTHMGMLLGVSKLTKFMRKLLKKKQKKLLSFLL